MLSSFGINSASSSPARPGTMATRTRFSKPTLRQDSRFETVLSANSGAGGDVGLSHLLRKALRAQAFAESFDDLAGFAEA